MPLANAPAILNLLDGPVDVDPAFHIVWSRFRMMRRYVAYCLKEEPRIFQMLDFISRVGVSLPHLRMMIGHIQHFRSAILDAWRFSVFARLAERKGFLGS